MGEIVPDDSNLKGSFVISIEDDCPAIEEPCISKTFAGRGFRRESLMPDWPKTGLLNPAKRPTTIIL